MSAVRSILAVSALLGAFASAAEAQGVVPGGWAAQFGYQPFGGGGLVGGGAFATAPNMGGGLLGGFTPFGPAMPGLGFNQGIAPAGFGFVPSGFQTSPYASAPAIPQTTIATDPLINAIQQSTRRSRRR